MLSSLKPAKRGLSSQTWPEDIRQAKNTMVKKQPYVFRELPLKEIHHDANQPRKNFGTEGDENRLLLSIEEYGIEQPLIVHKQPDGTYIILDGHRRYICAQRLGLTHIPCRIYSDLSPGEFESRRYEIQNNRRPWKPLERAEALQRIKGFFKLETNKELAHHLHISESAAANSLQLGREKWSHLELMANYGLTESYQIEFVRLKPKIRRIKDLEVQEVIKRLFEKVKHKVIRSAKDFRILGRIFLRATANETELYRFLTNPDMTVNELEQRTIQSGFSLLIEQLIQKITTKRNEGVAFSSQEKNFLNQLAKVLQKTL